MKRNNGFTLIELLATIAILGIVLTLSISSYIKYADRIKNQNTENNEELIRIAALNYNNTTGKNSFFVKELITSNYLKTSSTNYKINDIDYSCFYINIVKEEKNNKIITNAVIKDNYNTGVIDNDGYSICDDAKLNNNFIISYNSNTLYTSIPSNSRITILSNLGDYYTFINNTSTVMEKNINVPIINNQTIIYTATLKDKDNIITSKKLVVEVP